MATLAPELHRELLEAVMSLGTQADVARALGTDAATVSRWLSNDQGMEVGSCLKFALLRGRRPEDILRWAGYAPEDYLPSNFTLSDEAREIDMRNRARVMEWQRKREAIPAEFKSLADRTISRILDTYRDAHSDK